MSGDNERTDAQLTKYFEKVITNAAFNFYNKLKIVKEVEILKESIDENTDVVMPYDNLSKTAILSIPFTIENEKLEAILESLSEREQMFIIEKFVLGKKDREIAEVLKITRSGVTNFKHRLYKKIRNKL